MTTDELAKILLEFPVGTRLAYDESPLCDIKVKYNPEFKYLELSSFEVKTISIIPLFKDKQESVSLRMLHSEMRTANFNENMGSTEPEQKEGYAFWKEATNSG